MQRHRIHGETPPELAISLGTGEEHRRHELGVQAPPLDLLPRLLDRLHAVPEQDPATVSPPRPDLAGDRRRRARRRAAAWQGWRRTGGGDVGGVVLVVVFFLSLLTKKGSRVEY